MQEKKGFRTRGIQERRDLGLEGFKTGGKQEKRETANRIQEKRDSGQEGYIKGGIKDGYRKGWMRNSKYARKEGHSNGRMKEKRAEG